MSFLDMILDLIITIDVLDLQRIRIIVMISQYV